MRRGIGGFSVLAWMLGLGAGAWADPVQEPRFLRGFFEDDDLTCFESPEEIDWETLAHRNFREFALDAPPEDRIFDDDYRGFSFRAELPPKLGGLSYTALTASSAVVIRPEFLRGRILYGPPAARIALRRFSGAVCLSRPANMNDLAFVVAAERPLEWRLGTPETDLVDGVLHVRLGSRKVAVPKPPPKLPGVPEVEALIVLSSPHFARSYLLVRRKPDDTCERLCCQFVYQLYQPSEEMPLVAWSAHGCDV